MLCEKCGKEFSRWVKVEGKLRNLSSRKYCLDCSPFASHNTVNLLGHKKTLTSIIWETPLDILKKIIAESNTITEALNKLGIRNVGHNYKTFLKRVKIDNLDLTHIYEYVKKRKFVPSLSNSDIFIENSKCSHNALKRRLISSGLLDNKRCAICGLSGDWNGKPLTYPLDHINGIPNDNRIENLRFICSNCHSQTDTYTGRGKRKLVNYKSEEFSGIKPNKEI